MKWSDTMEGSAHTYASDSDSTWGCSNANARCGDARLGEACFAFAMFLKESSALLLFAMLVAQTVYHIRHKRNIPLQIWIIPILVITVKWEYIKNFNWSKKHEMKQP